MAWESSKITTGSPLQQQHGVKFPMLAWPLCLPSSPHQGTLSDMSYRDLLQEPFLWGEGGKGESRRASHSSGPCWAWKIRATCLLSDIKYSMSFLQVPGPKDTKAHLPLPHPFSPWILFKLLFTVPGVGTSQETMQASAPGLVPQHWSPHFPCLQRVHIFCSEVLSAPLTPGPYVLLLKPLSMVMAKVTCISLAASMALWNQTATRGCCHP